MDKPERLWVSIEPDPACCGPLRANDSDVEYVRADLYHAAKAKLIEYYDELEELRERSSRQNVALEAADYALGLRGLPPDRALHSYRLARAEVPK